jgi:hypothetical protein
VSRQEKVESPLQQVRNDAVQAVRFQPSDDEVRVRAYGKYCARNGAPGDAVADWLEAERDLVGERNPRPVRNQ